MTVAADTLKNLWDATKAQELTPPELLLYRSNLLGADLRITNYGGGNTSAKIDAVDPLTGAPARVLWVKGSGGDLGSMALDGFATLYLDKLRALKGLYRGLAHEDEMVGYLPHCTFGLNPRAASIDTPLHAFIPHDHVDHMHPDAVIAIAAAVDGERLTREIYGDEIGWLPWQRPGFDLGLRLEAFCAAHPTARGVVLGQHGLFTWADEARACYELTLRIIQQADEYLRAHGRARPFGELVVPPFPAEDRRRLLVGLLPAFRGRVSRHLWQVAHVASSPDTLEFAGSERATALSQLGTSCPDHFLRTKIRPLVVDPRTLPADPSALQGHVDALVDAYEQDYAGYYQRCARPVSPAMRTATPAVLVVPGVGLVGLAGDKSTARIASEFFVNAIHVMRGAGAVSDYRALPEQEAFDIEYWALEEAKLRRMPARRPLEGRVALITGGAGGIGRATAERLLAEGACAVVADLAGDRLDATAGDLARRFGHDKVRHVALDVTNEASVIASVEHAVLEYGGLDILVASAGIASAAAVEQTSLATWQRNLDVLATGYFLTAREGFALMRRQGLGGSIVFIGSKNGMAPSAGASAYCTAKAAELHLARCLALEGAPFGIRVNVVNPDAVLQGSTIWDGAWRQERADAYGIAPEQLEDFYRSRSLLKREVLPQDIAEAVAYFATDRSLKSTGNILNVDAGQAGAFPR